MANGGTVVVNTPASYPLLLPLLLLRKRFCAGVNMKEKKAAQEESIPM